MIVNSDRLIGSVLFGGNVIVAIEKNSYIELQDNLPSISLTLYMSDQSKIQISFYTSSNAIELIKIDGKMNNHNRRYVTITFWDFDNKRYEYRQEPIKIL